jgi:twinkle protein
MARMIELDDIDFRAYMDASESALKVRKASAYSEDVARAFIRRGPGDYGPHMRSTKIGSDLEFRPGEVTVWAGYNGHKKSMFTGQVALDLIDMEQRVLIISLEMDPAATLARMVRQALASPWPTPRRQADFMAWSEDRLWLFDYVGNLKPTMCFAVLRYFAKELQGTQVFIDSMMKVCQSEESIDEQKAMTADLCNVAKDTGLHVHLVAHCRKPASGGDEKPPTKYDLKGSGSISDMAHNVVTIWANKPKQAAMERDPNDIKSAEADAAVTVEKQRNGAFEGRVKLWFDPQTLRFVNDRTSQVDPYDIPANSSIKVPA